MKPSLRFFSLLIFLLSIPSTLHAKAQVALFPLQGTNVHARHLSAGSELLKLYLLESDFAEVDLVSEAAGESNAWTAKRAQAYAKENGHSLFLLGSLIRVGNRVRVSLHLYNSANGARLFSDSLDAAAPEDLDPVMKRLARSVAVRDVNAKASAIDEVTLREEEAFRKRVANHYFGILIGATKGFAGPLKDDPVQSGFGTYWLYDNRNMLLEVDLAFGFGEAVPFTFGLDLGIHYPFSRSDFTFYVGGGAGFSVLTRKLGEDEYGNSDTESARGLDVWAGAGMLVGRQSTVHFKADLKYVLNLFEIGDTFTHGLRFAVGIGF